MRVADLVEAEGRSFTRALRAEGKVLRESVTRLAFAAVALWGGGTFVGLGILVCLLSLFLALQPALGTPGAAAIVGGLCLAVGLLLLWFAERTAR